MHRHSAPLFCSIRKQTDLSSDDALAFVVPEAEFMFSHSFSYVSHFNKVKLNAESHEKTCII